MHTPTRLPANQLPQRRLLLPPAPPRLVLLLAIVAWALQAEPQAATVETPALRLSVYATAGDVLRHLVDDAPRREALTRIAQLPVQRVFLEGRRGDEYVPPETLAAVRHALAQAGLESAGAIATVPGSTFGERQVGGLDWLNWESPRTRQDVARFFAENAPLFDELIVDDFYCTGDLSPASEQARSGRSWGDYRRDLLVSLIQPLMIEPTRQAQPSTRLILKFPQWYDRFHVFGYDPPRMATSFAHIWVGTEVRDPLTRRMGFVQPTEGYINYRWIHSVIGDKVRGAWFDHIECSAENFVDQAFQSVLAGARELTLFRLGDLMASHPGDRLLQERWPQLEELAAKVQGRSRRGIAFYKPPGSDPGSNLYLADYLAVLGWPILPTGEYPAQARALVLGEQAAADREVVRKLRRSLGAGATVVVTPGFVRRAGAEAATLAGVQVASGDEPAAASRLRLDDAEHLLSRPLEVDRSLRTGGAHTLLQATTADGPVPLVAERTAGPGRILTLNVRTFSDEDFGKSGEWLLAPRPLGWTELPPTVVDRLRRICLGGGLPSFTGPARVGWCAFDGGHALHNFRSETTTVQLDGQAFDLPPHTCRWLARAEAGRP